MVFFILIVLVVALVLVRMAHLARSGWGTKAAVCIALWLCFTGAIAGAGLLTNFDPFPPPAAVLFISAFVLTVILAFSPIGRSLSGISLVGLIGFQAFRIAVEIFLDWGYHSGLVPLQMTFEGRNFDILAGFSAIPMAWIVARGMAGKGAIQIWNIAGALLLINIMVVAALSTPTRMFMFPDQIPNTFVTHVPYVWLPAFLVQAAWLGHLLVFRRSLPHL
jgi:hypothetical protein